MPGPAPKPTALKLLEGNPGKRPLPENEPMPEVRAPEMPRHLDRLARKEWRRMVPELQGLGLLARIDMAALAAYCVCYSRWQSAERTLKTEGLTVTTPNGYVQKSPHLQIADKALDQLRKYIAEFGLSPASRSRVTAAPQGDDDGFFE